MLTWVNHKLARVKSELERVRFVSAIDAILNTAPLTMTAGGPTVVTMVGRHDVSLYLLSVKSFARYCGPGRVVILDDGTLRADDATLLRQHIPGITIVSKSEVPRGLCQQGGCWERLCLIGELSAPDYVVQLDSDMLTLRRPDRLIQLVAAQRSFTMPGDLEGSAIMSARQAAAVARSMPGDFFQLRFERALSGLPDPDTWNYVRGCAALSAFPRRSISLAGIEALHQTYESLVGVDAWKTWGSEQITSNTLVVQRDDAEVLPLDLYCSHFPRGTTFDFSQAAMVHFIGTHRYENGTYQRLALRVLRDLPAA